MANKLEEAGISLLIIGAQTKPTVLPRLEWLPGIVQAADKADIRVFLKDNLKPLLFKDAITGQAALDAGLLTWAGELRQEMPR